MNTETEIAPQTTGLYIARSETGWNVYVDAIVTGFPLLGISLRLRRHAEAALADLVATGVDFTVTDVAAIRSDPNMPALNLVLGTWYSRAQATTHDAETGEYYSTYVPYGSCSVLPVAGVSCPRCGKRP